LIAETVLVDAGPLVAILYERELRHRQCVETARDLPEVLFTCWPVITEAAYLLRSSWQGVSTLLAEVERRRLEILPLTAADVAPIAAILARFHDQGFDFADACLMHLAERERIERVFTLDRRHFSVFRTSNGDALTLLGGG
jgi:predicted nucleic acid-binding protein